MSATQKCRNETLKLCVNKKADLTTNACLRVAMSPTILERKNRSITYSRKTRNQEYGTFWWWVFLCTCGKRGYGGAVQNSSPSVRVSDHEPLPTGKAFAIQCIFGGQTEGFKLCRYGNAFLIFMLIFSAIMPTCLIFCYYAYKRKRFNTFASLSPEI